MFYTRSRRYALAAVAAAAFVAGATPSQAQPQDGVKAPIPHHQILSANPFGLMLGWWNVEFERTFTPSSTWGVSTSFLSVDDVEYGSLNALFRYYPQGAGFRGFFLGGRAGYYHLSDEGESGSAFGLGFEIGYTWLLGARRNVGLSLGAGLTRIIAGDIQDGPSVLPTVRLLNVGIAF
jgi:hypothetical protein